MVSFRVQLSSETIVDPLLRQYQHLPNPGVVFKAYVSPSVPAKFRVDGLRVRQVLANGVTNALKHTKSGFVVIEVRKAKNHPPPHPP